MSGTRIEQPWGERTPYEPGGEWPQRLVASETSLAWEMLAQHAQARRERDLLDVTGECHPQTLRQVRWANSMIKTLSPQALAASDA